MTTTITPSANNTIMPYIDPRLDEIASEFCHRMRYQLNNSERLIAVWGVGPNGSFGAVWDRRLKCQHNNFLDNAPGTERLARQLLQRVAQRWPAGLAPQRIGLLCDGTGVAVAPEDPWPLAPGWLDRRIARPSSLVALRRFDPSGNWARICGRGRQVTS